MHGLGRDEHVDITFSCMGSQVRLILEGAGVAALGAERWLTHFDRRLSRFQPGSELSHLNRDRG